MKKLIAFALTVVSLSSFAQQQQQQQQTTMNGRELGANLPSELRIYIVNREGSFENDQLTVMTSKTKNPSLLRCDANSPALIYKNRSGREQTFYFSSRAACDLVAACSLELRTFHDIGLTINRESSLIQDVNLPEYCSLDPIALLKLEPTCA